MNAELFITNISFAVSILVGMGLGTLVLIRRTKNGASNVVFFLAMLATTIWQVSYVLGINIHDPFASRLAFMFNLATLFLVILFTHLILAVTDRLARHKIVLCILYVIAGGLCIFYAIFPDTFILPSRPIMYLPNFFVPGSLYEVQDSFFFIVLLYMLFQLMVSYRHADYQMRNRLKYLFLGIMFGFGVGLVSEFLLYGIMIDPFASSLVGLYTIPMAYAILKYDALDLNIIAKRALGSALAITLVTGFILLTGYANDYITQAFPEFPLWLLPLFSGIIAMFVGLFAWNKIREVDILKYQFIDVVTHKFRTPITHIRWSLETLRTSTDSDERNKALDDISGANVRLYELTDSLMGVSGSGDNQYLYTFTAEDVRDSLKTTLNMVGGRLNEKKVTIETNIPADLPKIFVDRKRFQFVTQMIVENAIIYSLADGKIVISAEHKRDMVVISVSDFGIGVSKEDQLRLFSKFFRSADAMHAHTEGLGIGLYLSRDIMRRCGGDLSVESEGVGKGSTFLIKAPVVKS